MIKYLVLYIIFAGALNVISQNAKIDSLENLLNNKSDTTKINALNALSSEYSRIDITKSMEYLNSAYSLLKKTNFKKGYAEYYLNKGILAMYSGDYPNTILLADSALIYCGKNENLSFKMKAINLKGVTNYLKGYNDEALKYYAEANKIALKLEDKTYISKTYSNMGLIYSMRGDYEAALGIYYSALKVYEEQDNQIAIADLYGNFGNIYYYQRNFQKAKEYFILELNKKKSLGDKKGLLSSINNLGAIYNNLAMPDSALMLFMQAVEISKELDNKRTLSLAYNNIGNTYNDYKKDYNQAMIYYKKVLEISEELDLQDGICRANMNIAMCLKKTGNYNEALKYCLKSIEQAKNNKFPYDEKEGYLLLSSIYELKKDFENAYFAYKDFKFFNDSMVDIEKIKQTTEIREKYESEKKEQENILLKKDVELSALEINKKNLMIIILVIGILSAILVFLIIYLSYRNKQKRIMQEAIIDEQKHRTKAIIEAQETERKRIARELHDGIGQMLSAASMNFSLLSNINDIPKNEFNNSMKILNDACDEVRSISHQMMPKVLIESGLVSALGDLLNKSFKNSDINFQFHYNGLDSRLESNVEIGLYRISQELINNIIKHSKANTIDFNLYKSKNSIILSVEDNGIGLGNMKISGIGLSNIKSRAESLNGNFNIENAPIKGTNAVIRVPYKEAC